MHCDNCYRKFVIVWSQLDWTWKKMNLFIYWRGSFSKQSNVFITFLPRSYLFCRPTHVSLICELERLLKLQLFMMIDCGIFYLVMNHIALRHEERSRLLLILILGVFLIFAIEKVQANMIPCFFECHSLTFILCSKGLNWREKLAVRR